MINVGEQLRYLLGKHRWGLKNLSSHTGLSLSYLSDIQRGRTNPTLETLEKIALAFDMSLTVFLGGADLGLTSEEYWLVEAYRANDITEVLRMLVYKHDSEVPQPPPSEDGEVTEIPF